MRTLRKRLSRIQAKIPSKPSPEEEATFHELMAYLDSLATRKAGETQEQFENRIQSQLQLTTKTLN